MKGGYDFAVDGQTYRLLIALSLRERQAFADFFTLLAENPHSKGDFTEQDSNGRTYQVKNFRSWLITYWADHAVKELRIVRVERL